MNSEAGSPPNPDLYRRYLLQLTSFVLLIGATLTAYVHWFPMNYFSPDYPQTRYLKDFLAESHKQRECLLILGDSQSIIGFDPLALPVAARTISLAGGTPLESYYLLQNYLERQAAPRLLLLSFHGMSLEEAEFFWQRTVKFDLLTVAEAMEVFARQAQLGDTVLGDWTYFRYALYYLDLPFMYIPELRNSLFFLRRRSNQALYREVMENKGHLLSFVDNPYSDEINKMALRSWQQPFTPSPLLDDYLHRLLALAQSHGITVLWYTAPFNQASFDYVDETYIARYDAYVDRLAEQYSKLIIYRKMHALPNRFFADAYHSNHRGSEWITAQLIDYLQQHKPSLPDQCVDDEAQ